MPPNHGPWLHDKQGRSPAGPQACQPAQHDPIRSTELGSWNGSVCDDQLLPEHYVLGGQSGSAGEERPQERQDQPQDAQFRASVLGRKAGILRSSPVAGKDRKSCKIKEDGIFGMDNAVISGKNFSLSR
jgi:hypothetical protein